MNERTHFFIKIYLSHFILESCCVWEMSWRRGQTAILTPSSSSTIAALLSYLGWVAQPWVTEGCKALSLQAGSHTLASSLQLTRTAPGTWLYYCLTFTCFHCSSLIYSVASLDWRLRRGSTYNTTSSPGQSGILMDGHKADSSRIWARITESIFF